MRRGQDSSCSTGKRAREKGGHEQAGGADGDGMKSEPASQTMHEMPEEGDTSHYSFCLSKSWQIVPPVKIKTDFIL
jgi:hypothetical protein